jgi:signal transduction histidine kinase
VSTESVVSAAAGEDAQRPAKGGPERPKLRRHRDRALIGGVCAGVAEYLDVDPLVVRVLFVVVAVVTGFGLVVYPLGWALIPATAARAPSYGSGPWRRRFSAWREAIGIVVVVGVSILLLRHSGLWLGNNVVLPTVLASCGVALILRQSSVSDSVSDELRRRGVLPGTGTTGKPGWRRWPGGILGVVLVLAAAVVFTRLTGISVQLHRQIGVIAVLFVALALVLGPWFLRLARSLASERSQRIRSEERADLAAHLHDSVLQTLALIQRRADDPREVAGLARRQERELRHWLFERTDGEAVATLDVALEQAAADVEGMHGVRVEVVTVGDCPLDERLLATVSAAREALTNAAKFAGGDQIDLYAEVGEDLVHVYVRDRGVGFDVAAIPDDRRGVRHSILERMRQHGGRAEIHSEPDKGTEIELVMERPRT